MLNDVEYRQSATPEPYESAPTLEGLTSEEYQFFTEECAATEERDMRRPSALMKIGRLLRPRRIGSAEPSR